MDTNGDQEFDTHLGSDMDMDNQTEPEHPPTSDADPDDVDDAQTEEAEETKKEVNETREPEQESRDQESDEGAAERDKRKSRTKRDPVEIKREPGKSVFPVSRVQKILKADKDLPLVSKEAVFLISRATEEFIARIAQASQMYAGKESRTTVQRRDIALAVRRADEYWFLEEIIPWHDPEAEQRRKPKALQKDADDESRPKTMLDRFVTHAKDTDGTPSESGDAGDRDIVMNEDGTMSIAPPSEPRREGTVDSS